MRPTLFPAALVLSLAPAIGAAQEPTDWPTTCEAGRCTLSRTVSDTITGRSVATLLLAFDKAGTDLRLGAALPLGVAVEPGARLILGGSTFEARYEVCFPDGCRAMATLPPDQLGPLGEAAAIELRFFSFGQEKPIAIEVRLEGLANAIAAAQAQLAATP